MVSNTDSNYTPDYIVTPGEVLEDYLESYEMTQTELAARTGLTKKTINEIIKGKAPISHETALKFERVLGRPAHFWSNLERDYQEDKVRFAEQSRLALHKEWLARAPVTELAKRGLIAKEKNKSDQIEELLRFFGIASPEQWQAVWEGYAVAFRRSQKLKNNGLAISAWLRIGEIEAQRMPCGPFDKKHFKEVLLKARVLTRETPDIFVPKLQEYCSSAGVALLLVPEIPSAGVSGCTRWIGGKAVIQLSLRYKSNDHLWFTFFHEAGHILKHGRKEVFLEGRGLNGDKEKEADDFARDQLISPSAFRSFCRTWDGMSHAPIVNFANDIGIAPGIVVGRLQHEGLLLRSHGNKLKVFYHWA